ncbi:hypothetical protein [Erythrobacter donghaensis]|uniref:hypothetical protein n=1 Tax=Erythrobacter donghaensis TaxID=267135 RepID=UPI00117EE870|nr:hypothetical protein [Erythrobacter donghaensis]
MTRILGVFLVGAAALNLAACDDVGRRYPPGYTDDGIKFDEDGWFFSTGEELFSITYTGGTGPAQITIKCDRREVGNSDVQAVRMLDLVKLEVATVQFTPRQQWPQPDVALTIDETSGSGAATLEPLKDGATLMTFTIKGRARDRLLRGIRQGQPITLSFADQTRDIPGPPQSMREAFADKCRGRR